MNNYNYKSSQKSPTNPCLNFRQPIKGLYPNMFLEDFCLAFSYDLSAETLSYDRNFYTVEPQDDLLKNLLCIKTHRFLHYELDKLLSSITYNLIFNGKVHLEIVIWEDSEGIIKGISFVPINSLFSFKFLNKTVFLSILSYNKKPRLFNIKNENLITFRLKDLGYSRHYFIKLLKKLQKIDITNVTDMFTQQKSGLDFAEYTKNCDFKLLNITQKTHWFGRSYNNQHLSESYLLYRSAKFKILRKKFLDYLIFQLNVGISHFSTQANFNGKIVTNSRDTSYMKDFEQFWKGEINLTQLSNIIFHL